MRRASLFALTATLSLACSLPLPAFSAGQQSPPVAGSSATGSKTIYGSQLMTPAERSAYRQKMRSLKTAEEREAFRARHHEEMQKRAQERGMQLPDMPPAGGARGGMGPGMGRGMGPGMKQGAGMGPGMRQGSGAGMQRMRVQTEQETRERTQPQTSSSGKGEPTRKQTEQEQRERNTGDQSGGH